MEYKINKKTIIVRMDDNEDFIGNIKIVTKELDINGGVILTGLGMLKDVELAFLTYPRDVGNYKSEKFNGPFEVVSLCGDIAMSGDEIIPHIHIALADRGHSCVGGHLLNGKVNATFELFIQKLEKINRKKDSKTGLKIVDFRNN